MANAPLASEDRQTIGQICGATGETRLLHLAIVVRLRVTGGGISKLGRRDNTTIMQPMSEFPPLPAVQGKTIVLGVTGSIAAYKAADLTSGLVKAGAEVFVVMTREATEFITPMTLQVLSRHPVAVSLWDEGRGWQPGHIELADKADLMVIAPITAHTLSCLAHGLAPDLLTSLYLATVAPVVLAPAMNGKMLAHPATVANLEILKQRGHRIVEPAEGMLACGYEGKGKLADVAEIARQIDFVLAEKSHPSFT